MAGLIAFRRRQPPRADTCEYCGAALDDIEICPACSESICPVCGCFCIEDDRAGTFDSGVA